VLRFFRCELLDEVRHDEGGEDHNEAGFGHLVHGDSLFGVLIIHHEITAKDKKITSVSGQRFYVETGFCRVLSELLPGPLDQLDHDDVADDEPNDVTHGKSSQGLVSFIIPQENTATYKNRRAVGFN
jgi:hypothetical protein